MMVTLTWQEIVIASNVGLRRRIESMRRGFDERNGAERSEEARLWYYNIVGACGEAAVAKAMNLYWPAAINQRKDEADLGVDVQVRCLAGAGYDLIVRDNDHDNFRYVLCTGEPPTFNVVGWIRGADAKRNEWKKDRGDRNKPCFWVPQGELTPI